MNKTQQAQLASIAAGKARTAAAQGEIAMEARRKVARVLNNNWDALNEMHRLACSLFAAYAQLARDLAVPEIRNHVNDAPLLARLTLAMKADVSVLITELNEIHEGHKGKTGSSLTDDENITAIGIYQRYGEFFRRNDATLACTAAEMMEIYHQAAAALEIEALRLQNEADATDPTKITDLEVKAIAQSTDVEQPV